MTNFTSGEWKALTTEDGKITLITNGEKVMCRIEWGETTTKVEAEANAQLIVKAPPMYKGLDTTCLALEAWSQDRKLDVAFRDFLKRRVNKIRELLAKIEEDK